MDLLLYAPQYRPNLSSMIRTAEFFGWRRIFIHDAHELLTPPTNKKGRADMAHLARVWTAGAVDYVEIIPVASVIDWLQDRRARGRRLLGTLADAEAQPLDKFRFCPDDVVLFGNEREGLPPSVIELLDAGITIPGRGQTSCLNVAVSFGIVLQQALQDHQ